MCCARSSIATMNVKPTVASVASQLVSLCDKFDSMKKNFDEMKAENSNLNSVLTSKCQQIESLTVEVSTLRKKVLHLENSLDDEDAYVRRETIIFNGTAIPPSLPGEICNSVIREVIKDKLKIELQESDISVAHRAGKKPVSQGPDRRGIHVRFCRRDVKRQLIMTKRDNSDQKNTLYTNESLTPKRSSILFTLRQMKKKFPDLVKGCTSQDGRVFAFTPSPAAAASRAEAGASGSNVSVLRARDRKHLVNSQEALIEFSREFIQIPLDVFLESCDH